MQVSQTEAKHADPDEEALTGSITEQGSDVAPLAGVDTDVSADADLSLEPAPDTRQRILDVALDLFTEQGFDGTSLRQIAEQLGVTKAALYYHFESKDRILMALHLRLHEFGKDALMRMAEGPVTLELWGELLDEIVDQMLAQRKIFLMHERNQAALEKLHRKDHDAEHEDIQNRFRLVLADTRTPLEDRVRMAASMGVVFSSLFLSGDAFSSTTNEELGNLLRTILHAVLRG
jgi:AcrR family transcriptional regulator